jgi:hypothetical protein
MARATSPRRYAILLAGVGLVLGALAGPARPAAASPAIHREAVADVHVASQAYEGPRGTILADVRGRCAPGHEVVELVLDFSQGDVTTPSLLGRTFPCDGHWHSQRVTSLEAFEAGRAMLTARLTVVDVATGDPAPQAVETRSIYVRPAAKVVFPVVAHLLADGVVRIVVRARCDAPWVLQDFHVSLTQGEFPTVASADAYLDLTCDGTVRRTTLRLASSPVPFHRGRLLASGSITLLDPEQFDPVTQVTATRSVRLR